MKRELGKGVAIAAIALAVALIGWVGWRAMETPENRGLNEEAIFRAAEKKAKANGVDIRKVPQWGALYYKYHPEEKPPVAGQPPAGASTGPGDAPTMH
jgi:hypothetical protein